MVPSINPVVQPKKGGSILSALAGGISSAFNRPDSTGSTLRDYLNNAFTGNLDYQRNLEASERAERNSAIEAQKVRDFNAQQSQIARDFNASEAQKNRDFQERMSSTAYSRAVNDLKSVGINPYAIGTFGSASTPSGTALASSGASTGSMGSSYAGGSSYRMPGGFMHLFDSAMTAYQSNQNNVFSLIRSLVPFV